MEKSLMGAITDFAKTVYADGPGSAPTEPYKPDIRNLFGMIDTSLSSLINGLVIGGAVFYATRDALFADLSRPANTLGVVYADPTAGRNGVYVKAGASGTGSWTLTSLALPGTILADLNEVISDLADEVAARQALEAKTPDLGKQSGIRKRYVTGTRKNQTFLGDAYSSYLTWIVGAPMFDDVQDPATIDFWASFDEIPKTIAVRVTTRPKAIGNGSTEGFFIYPGSYSADKVLRDWTWFDADDLLIDLERSNQGSNFQLLSFPIRGIGALKNTDAIFGEIQAKNAAGTNIKITLAYGRDGAGQETWRKGVFSNTLVTGPYVTPSNMVAMTVTEAIYDAESAGADSIGRPVIAGQRKMDLRQSTSLDASNWVVSIPSVSIDMQPEVFANDSDGINLIGIPKVTAGRTRYDDIVVQPYTGQLLKVAGTERPLDCNEYLPAKAGGFYPLLRTRTDVNGVEILPTYQWDGLWRRGGEARMQKWIHTNRQRLIRLFGKLSRGLPIRMIGYGDSITAIGGGNGEPYTPNGPNRDVIDFFTNIQSDTRASIPRYDGDGGVGAHVHLGMNWIIKQAIEQRFGCLVEYLNMGIAGTTDDATFTDGIGPNGRYPARLAAATALGGDVVFLAFGMNNIPSLDSYANLVAMGQAFQAVGCEVVIVPCKRPGRSGGPWVHTRWWQIQEEQAIRAADAINAAYIPWSWWVGPGNEAGFGCSVYTMAQSNGTNHMGPFEERRYGEIASLIFA